MKYLPTTSWCRGSVLPPDRSWIVSTGWCFPSGASRNAWGCRRSSWRGSRSRERLNRSISALERLELICDTYLSVSTPVQIAAGDLLVRGESIREQISRRISANYLRLREQSAAAPWCRVLPSDGGWYAVLETPKCESEEALVVDLLRRDSVLAHPGYFFDFPRESYLVVSLLTPESQFAQGIDRVLRRVAWPVVSHD